MTIKAGLVGLPNVGKSTLFNALTKSQVPAENYPFCTIDPHLAITQVPDKRLDDLAKIYGSQKHIPATMSFVDIAGLVKGAAQGEGLGNQFLSNIREVDLILHVVRCFEATDNDPVNPLDHFDIIVTELALKDLEMIEKRQAKIASTMKAVQNKPTEKKLLEDEALLLKQIQEALNAMNIEEVRSLFTNTKLEMIPLLTAKKFLIAANMSENDFALNGFNNNPFYQAIVKRFGQDRVIPVCARTEYELAQLDDAQKKEMMEMLDITFSGIDTIITKAYHALGLITFFTVGPKEAHAWPIKKGLTVKKAAGEIHSDLERGFICADVFSCQDILTYGSEAAAKTAGKMRTEGQDYIVQDGDQLHIKFNV